MAEIVRTHYTITTQEFSRRNPGEPQAKTAEEITVRSIRSDRLDVSALKDLVAALDEAGVPETAVVVAEKSGTGHLVQLRVERARVPTQEVVAPEPTPDPDHACAAHDDVHLGQACPDRTATAPNPLAVDHG